MRCHFKQDAYVWHVVEHGSVILMKDGPRRSKIPKGILEMNPQEANLFFMENKAKNIISCGLDINEYNQVLTYEMTQETWRLLEVSYEGRNQVKETKITMLVQRFEAFKMRENESLKSSSTKENKEKRFKPRKALLTWDDSHESDKEVSENDEVAQLSFLAKDDHSSK
ncbi:hypothetical protein RJ640_026805, partial [Escallonia rubra]